MALWVGLRLTLAVTEVRRILRVSDRSHRGGMRVEALRKVKIREGGRSERRGQGGGRGEGRQRKRGGERERGDGLVE